MFNSSILDVAIGLIFIYLVLSLICTSLNEAIAQALGLRAENLFDAIHGMFAGPDAHVLADKILNHDLVLSTSYTQTKTVDDKGVPTSQVARLPSYMEPQVFSRALTDLLQLEAPETTGGSGSLAEQLKKAPFDSATTKILEPLILAANNDLDKALKNIEAWYQSVMVRASGWYKKRIQVITFCVATVVVIVVNADTLMVANTLMMNQVTVKQVETQAEALRNANPNSSTANSSGSVSTISSNQEVNASSLTSSEKQAAMSLIGWSNAAGTPKSLPDTWGDWARKLLGLLITIFAASLGAPFWFDALGKIMTIRSAGSSPDEDAAKKKPSTSPDDSTGAGQAQGANS